MSEEWGPWVEHDGRSKPKTGVVTQKEYANGLILTGMVGVGPVMTSSVLGIEPYAGETFASSWVWSGVGDYVPIIRYRIRKPRGMTILENLISDLPAPSLEPSPINETAPREELPA